MNPFEKILRFLALPVAVFLAVVAMWWVWATYPKDEDFFLTRILPFYSLYLTLAAVSFKVLSGPVQQFILINTLISSLFVIEIFIRVFYGILLF